VKLHKDSHLDHALTDAHVAYIMERFGDYQAFFIVTVDLPDDLAPLPCALMGPLVGDEPVPESEVTYRKRGDRAWESRTIECAYPRTSRKVTVIAGPHDGESCVLYTAYGGPCAPQEPGDPGCKDKEASAAFWAQHALIVVTSEG
jgi:hypothetical protein